MKIVVGSLGNRNRDIMPACVATSYQRIGNEPYQREYTRDETEHLSESSSPGSPKYENNFKSHTQSSPSLHYSVQLNEASINLPHVSGGRKKRGNLFQVTPSEQTTSKAYSHSKSHKTENSKELDECKGSRNPSCKNGDESNRVNVANSPKQSHPLKKRILQNTDNDSKGVLSQAISRSSTNNSESNTKKTNNPDNESSSEILQKMYASFGPTLNSHFSKANPFNTLKNLSNIHPEKDCNIQHQNYIQPQNEESANCFSQKANKRNDGNMENDSGKNSFLSRDKSAENKQSSFNDQKIAEGEKMNYQKNAQSSQAKVLHLKHKSRREYPKKRKLSSEFSPLHAFGSRDPQKDSASPVEDAKRVRYSSSDSNDSTQDRKSLPSLYKQNGSWLPFVNPLLYPSTGFNPLTMPSSGCNFPLPGYPQPNPLLFGSNPYLTNSVMMREMMSSAGLANAMPFLPNHNFSSLPGSNGVSSQQLQALHQLQSAMLCQNMSPLSSNPYQTPPSMLPPMMQNPLLAAKRQVNSRHSSETTTFKTDRSPSPLVTSPKTQPDIKNSSFHKEGNLSHFPNLLRRKKKMSGPPRNCLKPEFSSQDETTKQGNEKRFHLNTSKNESFSKPQHKFLNRAKSSSKKRHERRTKDSAKSKGTSSQKISTNESLSLPMKQASNEQEDLTKIPIDSPPANNQSLKSSSYKNLTRERRLVANARERTRVHTISSAFDELRAQIPSYSCNQKLSKLAILRIACEYIRTLSVLVGRDESLTFAQGVDQCTKVLQSESRARSRRKNNKAQIEMEMENYERHRSREENDSLDGASSTQANQPSPPLLPYRPHDLSSSSTNDNTNLSSETPSTNDDVYNDVIETDNDIVDVESVDDDPVFLEHKVHNSNTINLDESSLKQTSPAIHLPARCADEPSQLDARSTEIIVE